MIYTDGFHIAADTLTELYYFAKKYNLSYQYLLGVNQINFVCPLTFKTKLSLAIKKGEVQKLDDAGTYSKILKMNDI